MKSKTNLKRFKRGLGLAMGANRGTLGDEVATKNDLGELRSETRAEFASVRAEMRSEFASIRKEIAEFRSEVKTEIASLRIEISKLSNDILFKSGGISVACSTIGFAALGLMIHFH